MARTTDKDQYFDQDLHYETMGFRLLSVRSRQMNVPLLDRVLAHRRDLVRFINSLYAPYHDVHFMLRTVIQPQDRSHASGKIDVFLLAWTNKKPSTAGEKSSEDIFDSLKLLLGGCFPNHIWQKLKGRNGLIEAIISLDWKNAYFAEVRRREEFIRLDTLIPQWKENTNPGSKKVEGLSRPLGVYYVHPFIPSLLGNERVLATLLHGKQKIVLTTRLSPTTLTREEHAYLQNQLAMCAVQPAENGQSLQTRRASDLENALLRQHLLLQSAPFFMTCTIASDTPLDPNLLQLIAQSISEPVGQGLLPGYESDPAGFQAGGYEIVTPIADAQFAACWENMILSEYDPWQTAYVDPSAKRLHYLVDANEASSAFYLPFNGEFDLPGIETHYLFDRPLPREIVELQAEDQQHILIGRNYSYGFDQDVVLPEETRRQHTYIIGQTGTGKTTLMKTMILSDMKAGHGLAVIDPHGELYKDILEMIPRERKQDVVLFDPSDVEFPVGFNLLEVKSDEEREYVVKEMRAIMKRLFTEHFGIVDQGAYIGPIFFTHVQNNMLLAMSDQDNPGTIVEFKTIFDRRDFWKRWMPLKWENYILRTWVEDVLPNSDYLQVNRDGVRYGDYFSSKFEDFVNDPRLNLIFGQPRSTIDFAKVIDEKKILLVNLSKGLLGEANASLMGMLLMAKLNAVFMERVKYVSEADKSNPFEPIGFKTKLAPFYLYVDEFQDIATENFSILLAEARKFGLGMILANQYLKQVEDHRIRNAILGNVGTLISFRLGIDDAELLASQFLPYYNFRDLCDLPNYQAVMRTSIKGERTTPFNFKTILLKHSIESAQPEEVISQSREKYATPQNLAIHLVEDSLDEHRFEPSEFYWERKGKPESQRLIHVDFESFLNACHQDPTESGVRYWRINDRLTRQIFHYLGCEIVGPRHGIGQVLQGIKNNRVNLLDNMEQYLKQYFEPGVADLVHEVLGIYNYMIRSRILDYFDGIDKGILNDDGKKVLQEIRDLIKKEHWVDASKMIAPLFRDFNGGR